MRFLLLRLVFTAMGAATAPGTWAISVDTCARSDRFPAQ
jgi:hypothetical protein